MMQDMATVVQDLKDRVHQAECDNQSLRHEALVSRKEYRPFQGSQMLGLAEPWIADRYIAQELKRHALFGDPISRQPEPQRSRELRLMLFSLLVDSLGEWRAVHEQFVYGDCRSLFCAMLQLGQVNATRRLIDVDRALANHSKMRGMGYITFERSLRELYQEANALGKVFSDRERTTRLIVGAEEDRRYRDECLELSRCSASYFEAHKLLLMRATAINDLTDGKSFNKSEVRLTETQSAPKQAVCAFYLQGKCNKGALCPDKHSNTRPSSRPSFQSGRAAGGKGRKGARGGSRGRSGRGQGRGRGRDRPQPRVQPDKEGGHERGGPSKHPASTSKRVCFSFRDTGRCSHGSSCKYDHVRGSRVLLQSSTDVSDTKGSEGNDVDKHEVCDAKKTRFDLDCSGWSLRDEPWRATRVHTTPDDRRTGAHGTNTPGQHA